MANRGGTRPGAGRKKKAQTHEGAIKRAEKRCADRLPALLDTLEKIAGGGVEQVEETFELAGMIVVDDTQVITDERGNEKVAKVRRLAFPDEDADALIMTKRVVRTSAPDRAANEYLINRVMGTPTQKHEFSSLSDAELLEEATRLFGRNDSSGDSTGELSE